jgi:hypothetical protein
VTDPFQADIQSVLALAGPFPAQIEETEFERRILLDGSAATFDLAPGSDPGTSNALNVIVDEALETVRRVATQDQLDNARGRLIVVYMRTQDAVRIPKGSLLYWNGQQWKLFPPRSVLIGNLGIIETFVAEIGNR